MNPNDLLKKRRVSRHNSVFPARSFKFLTVLARDAQDDIDFLVEGNKVMCINKGIALPSMITSLRKGKVSIWVTNCENQARCIPKGMCIANAEPARSECLNTLTEAPSYTDLWTSKCSDQIDFILDDGLDTECRAEKANEKSIETISRCLP
ncbi:hypothetical protein TNCV_625761 [Trichonephila clavipes]|nr:hypothetical protein TNCV_625761 [Trichonephila clavipes]